jgi:putative spermidine/putrescine transport system substrate-binding protein
MAAGMMGLSRRTVLRAATGALAAPYVIPARAADTLVVNGYGAEFQEIITRTTIEPFEKKFGVKVTYDNTGSAAQNYAKIRASRGAPGFDVAAELTPPEVILGQKEKLLETITEAEVPNLKHVWPKSRTIIPPTGVVHSYQYLALLWNKTHLEKPASWANYWEPGPAYGDKIKGHLIAFEPANLLSVYALIMAAKLKGGGVENLAPAWELLQAQKPWIGVSVMASDAAAPYFENDQVWLAPFWSARSGYYVGRNYPVDFTIPPPTRSWRSSSSISAWTPKCSEHSTWPTAQAQAARISPTGPPTTPPRRSSPSRRWRAWTSPTVR